MFVVINVVSMNLFETMKMLNVAFCNATISQRQK